jgi:hypothetical protein
MVRTQTDTHTIQNLFVKLTDHTTYGHDAITITSQFQRGDEETGVWALADKQKYIKALRNHYPTGIIVFVKDTEIIGTWKVLDGGNRLRAIRDFITNKFNTTIDDTIDDTTSKTFEELTPRQQEQFYTIMIPCQWQNIEVSDHQSTIAEMFCGLNTSAVKLSPGELFKAHGWKGNIWEIEMAKKLVGGDWNPEMNNERVNSIRAAWSTNIGELSETKRCGNLAMVIGYIISAKTGNFNLFDTKYDVNKNNLNPYPLPPPEENTIYVKLEMFIDFVREVEYPLSIFGRPTRGMPSKLKIAPIWKPICEGTLTASLRANMISFYKTHALDVEVLAEYNRLLTKNGDNHTSASKIIAVHAYINTFA